MANPIFRNIAYVTFLPRSRSAKTCSNENSSSHSCRSQYCCWFTRQDHSGGAHTCLLNNNTLRVSNCTIVSSCIEDDDCKNRPTGREIAATNSSLATGEKLYLIIDKLETRNLRCGYDSVYIHCSQGRCRQLYILFHMGAPKAMSTTQEPKQSGFKKFFRRKSLGGGTTKSEPFTVAAPPTPGFPSPEPEKSLSSARSVRSNSKKKLGLLGWSKKDVARPESPTTTAPSQASREEIATKQDTQFSNENERISSIHPIPDNLRVAPASPESSKEVKNTVDRSPKRESLFHWQDNMVMQEEMSVIQQKQHIKERDGFCRRVDKYDGSVIHVEGEAAYELGNYLGGGVAGVVYEGHRLLPESEYPVRRGLEEPTPSVIDTSGGNDLANRVDSILSCVPGVCEADNTEPTTYQMDQTQTNRAFMLRDNGSMLTADSFMTKGTGGSLNTAMTAAHTDSIALEAVHDMVVIDSIDAPSRSKHLARAVTAQTKKTDFPSDGSFTNTFMEETVAIKILNPVGFRALSVDVTDTAVVARQGAPLPTDFLSGKTPMEEKYVWWLINPSSRNLRTLQRYTVNSVVPRGVEVDRGCAEKGLRISLIAAYKDPATKKLKELPLTRCIEIWGHVPFEASDAEFREVVSAIESINHGLPPPAIELMPGRVGTATSSMGFNSLHTMEDLKLSTPAPMHAKRT